MRIVNHTGDSSIVSIRICTRVFIHIGLKFISDREDFLVEIYILLSLVLFGKFVRGEKVQTRLNHRSYMTIFWDINRPCSLVWLVMESNYDLISAWDIPQLVQSADCICEEIVSILPLPLLLVELQPSLARWNLTFFWASIFLWFYSDH